MEEWGTPLSEMGCSLATKISILGRVIRRFDAEMVRLNDELKEKTDEEIRTLLRGGFVFTTRDEHLPYDILAAVETFLFESRSAYEIVGKFLREFFQRILGQTVTEEALITGLEADGVDIRWIDQLRDHRVLFFHNTAPWIALEVVSWQPRRFELLVLKKTVPDEAGDIIRFKELVDISRGFQTSLGALHLLILKRIEEFESLGRAVMEAMVRKLIANWRAVFEESLFSVQSG
jgi:hypothetical protein